MLYKFTSIGGNAFGYCTGLASVVIGNSVTSIGGNAFYGCTGLANVVIPNSVKYNFQMVGEKKTKKRIKRGSPQTNIAPRPFGLRAIFKQTVYFYK